MSPLCEADKSVSLQGNTIKMGDCVILTTLLGKKHCRLAKVGESSDVYLKKERINLRTLVGSRFDSVHRLDRATRQLKDAGLTQEQLRDILHVSSSFTELNVDDATKDNRGINDDGSAQKLERDEIEALKNKGTAGDEIIRTLVENNATFKERNVFSQEKYLKKKQAKYSNLIRVLRPTPALLTEMYYSQGPMKISNLRLDSLAQMLTACNVRSGSKYMVIDTNMGLVTAAILDRLLGNGSLLTYSPEGTNYGQCVQVYLDSSPVSSWRQSVDALNLPSEAYDRCLSSINIRKLHKWESGTDDDKHQLFPCSNEDVNTKESDPTTLAECSGSNKDEVVDGDQDEGDSRDNKRRKLDEKSKKRAIRFWEEEKAINALKTKDMDGLLIITRNYDPTDLLTFLYRFLALSQPFAVFSPAIAPLLSCYQSLKGCAIHSRITETWFRHYQVLDSRTRPEMNMSGSGGFLLTGIKVEES